MPSLIDLMLEGRQIEQHGPWPRAVVDASVWKFAAGELAQGRWTLLGLWGEPSTVHMAIMDADGGGNRRRQPGLSRPQLSFGRQHHPPALRLERSDPRSVRVVGGRPARYAPLARSQPLGRALSAGRSHRRLSQASPYRFLPVEGDGLHQIAVGPVHAGIIEPGHFRFTANGETVVRLEQRLGYTGAFGFSGWIASSPKPFRIVFGDMPSARLTARNPPQPQVCTSVAAQFLRIRSSIYGASKRYFVSIRSSVASDCMADQIVIH